jgi:dienelactone hydrolase
MKWLSVKILLLICLQQVVMAADTVKVNQPASTMQLNQWRNEVRKALFIPLPAPVIKPHVFDSFSPMPGIVVQHVTYGTQFGMRVPGVVYASRSPKGKVPAVIVVAGHGGDKATWYEVYVGLLYAKAGAVVITYDPIGENERSSTHLSNAREHDIALPGAQSPARMGGLMVGDVIQAVSYALSRPDVDPKRIAVLGYSMGSFHAALAAALDPRIRALELSGGGDLDGNGGAWDSSAKTMCQGGPYRALSFLPDKAAILYALHQRNGTTLILNGLEDGLITRPGHLDTFFADLRIRVKTLAGPHTPLLDYRFYPGIAHRPSWVNTDAFSWLHAQFHFANGDKLLSGGTTHISEWAAATGAHINKGYEVEDREGGIRAVGTDFPCLSPKQLQVVPTTDWEAHRAAYCWSSWAKQTLQAQGLALTLPVQNTAGH